MHSLWRKRDFMLLQLGQSLSSVGTQLTTVAYPLLALGVSGSARVATFAVLALMLALWGTLSPSIRTAPSLAEVAEPGPA